MQTSYPEFLKRTLDVVLRVFGAIILAMLLRLGALQSRSRS
jgi:hypothetical protein